MSPIPPWMMTGHPPQDEKGYSVQPSSEYHRDGRRWLLSKLVGSSTTLVPFRADPGLRRLLFDLTSPPFQRISGPSSDVGDGRGEL